MKKLGHITPPGNTGGGISIAPNKVDNLINPSTDQIDIHRPEKSYKKGDFILVKENRKYVIYKALQDTTGIYKPEEWEKYSLGNSMMDLKAQLFAATDELMAEIVKGSGASKFRVSGLLDFEKPTMEMRDNDFRPLQGLFERGYEDTYNGIIVDNTVLKVPTRESLKLEQAGEIGRKYELVFLEAYRVEEEGMPVMKHRFRSFGLSPIEYDECVLEGSYFLGLSRTRARYITAQGSNTKPLSTAPTDPNAKKFASFLSFSERTERQHDTGLWIAGDGSSEAKAALGTVDGYVYAIPLMIVNRRNTSKGSRLNPQGADKFVQLQFNAPANLTAHVSTPLEVTIEGSISVGMQFKLSGEDKAVLEYTGVDSFDRPLFKPVDYEEAAILPGRIYNSVTSNPFNLYSDLITGEDVQLIQKTIVENINSYSDLLDSNFNKLMRGELLSDSLENVVEIFEEEKQSLSNLDASNLVPVIHQGKRLVNVLTPLRDTKAIQPTVTTTNVTLSEVIKDDFAHEVTVTAVGTLGAKTLIGTIYHGLTVKPGERYLVAMQVASERNIRIMSDTSTGVKSGTIHAIITSAGLTTSIPLFVEGLVANTPYTFSISDMRMYKLEDGETPTLETLDASYPMVSNAVYQVQNMFEPASSDSILLKNTNQFEVSIEAGANVVLGSWEGFDRGAILTGSISLPNDQTTVTLKLTETIGTTPTVTFTKEITGKNLIRLKELLPGGFELTKHKTELSIHSVNKVSVSFINLTVSPRFAHMENVSVPKGRWDVSNDGLYAHVHTMDVLDKYRKSWSNFTSQSVVTRKISPIAAENPSDIEIVTQKSPNVFSDGDEIRVNAKNVVGPVVNQEALLNGSKVTMVSGNLITLSNVDNLNVGERVNIYNPYNMRVVVSNALVQTVDVTNRVVTFDTLVPIAPGYVVLESGATPVLPTLDESVKASWVDINTHHPLMKIKNLYPPISNQTSQPIDLSDLNEVFKGDPDINTPVDGWKDVSFGYDHVVALKHDGTIWGWGSNENGQLGIPIEYSPYSNLIKQKNVVPHPTKMSQDSDWAQVCAGRSISYLLKSDGSLWVTTDKSTDASTIKKIGTDNDWKDMKVNDTNDLLCRKNDESLYYFNGTSTISLSITLPVLSYDLDAKSNFVYLTNDNNIYISNIYNNSPTPITTSPNSYKKWLEVKIINNDVIALDVDGVHYYRGDDDFKIMSAWLEDVNASKTQLTKTSINNLEYRIGSDNSYTMIVSRYSHTIALKKDGSLWAWGRNEYGQLGDGTNITRLLPTRIGTDVDWSSISCGDSHTMALKKDGSLWAWGYNAGGQLGDGTDVNKSTPTKIGTNTDWLSVSCGDHHTIALKKDGSLWAWGYNNNGQLGDGEMFDESTPTKIGTSTDWLSVSCGDSYTMALKKDGSLWAWGYNAGGQLGDGTDVNKSTPTKIGTSTDWVSVSCGDHHTIALKKDGSLWAWGYNNNGQLGDGDTFDTSTPEKIGTNTDWLSVSCGQNHTVALKKDGSLWAWGYNNKGQLGDGTTVNKSTPTKIGTNTDWLSVSCGDSYTIALKKDGSLWAWGYNNNGQLGDGTTVNKSTPITIDNTVLLYNIIINDKLYQSSPNNKRLNQLLNNDYKKISLSAAKEESLMIDDKGLMYHLGDNSNGLNGSESLVNSKNPVLINKAIDMSALNINTTYTLNANRIAVAQDTTLIIKQDGTLWSMGTNDYGTVGDDTVLAKIDPYKVNNDTDWWSVHANQTHVLALKRDGSLWAWGSNTKGELGLGHTNIVRKPTKVDNSEWLIVDCGLNYSIGIKKDGSLWGCGINTDKQLGDDNSTIRTSFSRIGTDNDWSLLSSKLNHTLLIKKDGSLWTCGKNNYSQLGDGGIVSTSLKRIGSDNDWTFINAGSEKSFAIKKDGSLWAWGKNDISLGLGTQSTPVKMPTRLSGTWSSVKSNGNTTLAQSMSGETFYCGLVQDGKQSSSSSLIKFERNLYNYAVGSTSIVGENSYGAFLAYGDSKTGQFATPLTTKNKGPIQIVLKTKRFERINGTGGDKFNIYLEKENSTLWASGTFDVFGNLKSTVDNIVYKVSDDVKCATLSYGSGNSISYIKKDGSLWAWGRNDYGQLGDGTTVNKSTPVRIGTDTDWENIISGVYHTMALKKDGSLWAWGFNGQGQLGDGTTINKPTPTKIGTDTDWLSVSCGTLSTIALKKDGSLWAWGHNGNGQLGDGTTTNKSIPTKIGTDTDWVTISCGASSAVAGIKKDGSLFTWGYNAFGELGDGTKVEKTIPTKIGTDTDWIEVSVGRYYMIALKKDSSLWGWGSGTYGQFGDGGISSSSLTPKRIRLNGVSYIMNTSIKSSFYVSTNDYIYAAGDNNDYSIGYTYFTTTEPIGRYSENFRKVEIPGDILGIGAFCSGGSFVVSKASTNYSSAVLSDGNLSEYPSKSIVKMNHIFTEVSCGDSHIVSIKKDGSLWVWGYNNFGQLGDGTTVDKLNPTKIGTDTDWLSVSCGTSHTIALKKDGSLWAWGHNTFGQSGNGTIVNRLLVPTKIGTDTDWLSVSCGNSHTIALKKDGSLWAWGYNGNGQLGHGTTVDKSTPTRIGMDTDWLSVSCKGSHTIALKKDGSLWAWGYNNFGQLGDGTTVNKLNPTKIGTDTDWLSVSCGSNHTIALKKDGSLWAWGYNNFGQLGDGTTVNKLTPTKIEKYENIVDTLAGGVRNTMYVISNKTARYHSDDNRSVVFDVNDYILITSDNKSRTIALKKDGSLWACGYNNYGQLGDGTTVNKSTPVRIGTNTDWSSVSCGQYHTVALKKDGSLWAWGYNAYGQLGDGTVVSTTTPTKIGTDTNWLSVSCGATHTVALKKDGSLWAWGNNGNGQLGDGTSIKKLTPTKIGTDTDWLSVSCGYYHTIALKKDGSLWAWGSNSFGQLGDGSTVDKSTPTKIGIDADWISISCGIGHTTALKKDGSLWAWGYNNFGQLGDGTVVSTTTPTKIGTDTNWLSVSCGATHTVALKKDGSLWTWGANSSGQLGDGTTVDKSTPTKIGEGYDNSLGLFKNGNVLYDFLSFSDYPREFLLDHMNGIENFESVGTSTDAYLYTNVLYNGPILISHSTSSYHNKSLLSRGYSFRDPYVFDSNIKKVSISNTIIAVLLEDSSLYVKGSNVYGQLAMSDSTKVSNYIKIMDNCDTIAVGDRHVVVIKKDGSLWAWGYNGNGQLGDGTTSQRLIPTKIGTGADWLSVSCGQHHTIALKKDGSLWAWGYNGNGQLGDGTTTNRLTPSKIGTDTDWLSVSCSSYHTAALKKDGSLWTWGANSQYQLGDGTSVSKLTPTKIGTGGDWLSVSCGPYHAIALKKDGSLWTWGFNEYGQLGDGTKTHRMIPTKIGTDTDWVRAACGPYQGTALKKDGSLWAWGRNTEGQLGIDTKDNKTSPYMIHKIDKVPEPNKSLEFDPNVVKISLSKVELKGLLGDVYKNVKMTSSGTSFHAVLTYDGSIYTWGDNTYGQLGHGDSLPRTNPTKIVSDTKFKYIDCGPLFMFAIDTDNKLWSVGYNATAQLGQGDGLNKSTLTLVNDDNDWLTVKASQYSGHAIKKNGTLWGWGHNGYYQQGGGTDADKLKPVQIGVDSDWKTISVGFSHMIAIKQDGTIWATGSNDYGQLGNGTTTQATTLKKNGTKSDWVDVICSFYGTIAIDASGDAWGTGQSLQNGQNVNNNTFTKITDVVSAKWINGDGFNRNIALINTDGETYVRGDNAKGQLGLGHQTGNTALIKSTVPSKYVSVGAEGLLFTTPQEDLFAVGNNASKQVQDTADAVVTLPVQKELPNIEILPGMNIDPSTWIDVAHKGSHAVAIREDGSLWTWGSNDYGQLGDGSVGERLEPARVGNSTAWKKVFAGLDCSFAIDGANNLYAWGNNVYNKLGFADGGIIEAPRNTGLKAILVDGGVHHTAILSPEGKILVSGSNANGQLGLPNTTTEVATFTQLNDEVTYPIRYITTGDHHTFIIDDAYRLWSTGLNDMGQLGLPKTNAKVYKLTEVKIGTVPVNLYVSKIVSVGKSSLAIAQDGKVYGFGESSGNKFGPLFPKVASTDVPTIVDLSKNNIDIALSTSESFIVKSNKSLWRLNSDELMVDEIDYSVTKIVAGKSILVIKTNKGLWTSGEYKSLGDATTVDRTRFSRVNEKIVSIHASEDVLVALSSAGDVFTTGKANLGQLGTGSLVRTKAFNKVNISSVIKVCVGESFVIALTGDGKLYGWGSNSRGQIIPIDDASYQTQFNTPVLIDTGVANIDTFRNAENIIYAKGLKTVFVQGAIEYGLRKQYDFVEDVVDISISRHTASVIKSNGSLMEKGWRKLNSSNPSGIALLGKEFILNVSPVANYIPIISDENGKTFIGQTIKPINYGYSLPIKYDSYHPEFELDIRLVKKMTASGSFVLFETGELKRRTAAGVYETYTTSVSDIIGLGDWPHSNLIFTKPDNVNVGKFDVFTLIDGVETKIVSSALRILGDENYAFVVDGTWNLRVISGTKKVLSNVGYNVENVPYTLNSTGINLKTVWSTITDASKLNVSVNDQCSFISSTEINGSYLFSGTHTASEMSTVVQFTKINTDPAVNYVVGTENAVFLIEQTALNSNKVIDNFWQAMTKEFVGEVFYKFYSKGNAIVYKDSQTSPVVLSVYKSYTSDTWKGVIPSPNFVEYATTYTNPIEVYDLGLSGALVNTKTSAVRVADRIIDELSSGYRYNSGKLDYKKYDTDGSLYFSRKEKMDCWSIINEVTPSTDGYYNTSNMSYYGLKDGTIYTNDASLIDIKSPGYNKLESAVNVSKLISGDAKHIRYLDKDGSIFSRHSAVQTNSSDLIEITPAFYRIGQPGIWSDGKGVLFVKKDGTIWKLTGNVLSQVSTYTGVTSWTFIGEKLFIITGTSSYLLSKEGALVKDYGTGWIIESGMPVKDNKNLDGKDKRYYILSDTRVYDRTTGDVLLRSEMRVLFTIPLVDIEKGWGDEENRNYLESFMAVSGKNIVYRAMRDTSPEDSVFNNEIQVVEFPNPLAQILDRYYLDNQGNVYKNGKVDQGLLSEFVEDTIDTPIELSFTEMHPRSQGLERDVKDIHSVFVNGEKLVKNALVNVYKKPLTVMESPSNNPALGVVIDSQTDEFSFTAGKYLATTYTKPTNWEDIFNDSISKMKSYVMEINAKFNVQGTKEFTYVSPSGIPTVVPANTVKTVMIKNVTRDMLTQKAFNLGQIGTVPDATNQITVSKPMFDIVLLLNRDGWTTFTPQHIYADTHTKGKLNVVHISKEKGAMELEYPAFDKNDKLDTVEVYYKSNPKLAPVDNTDEMVILSESEHILVTDIGDVEFIKQGNNPYKNPLAQFDYNFSDLLGVIGYDGLTFSGDSVKTNVDSLVKVQNNVLVGGSQQSVVKSYNTPVAAIQRSLVYYKETVCLMITIVKSVDGVIDTQNGDITRYITPVEGNLHIPTPPSVKRRTIQQK